MAQALQTINLTTLNNFMKDFPSGIIVPEMFLWNDLYDLLKANCKKDVFEGNNVEILIRTTDPFTFTAFGENIDIPYGDTLGYTKMRIPLKEVIATASVTKQMMDRATGGSSSWAPVMPEVLNARKQDFLWGMEHCAIGDGTGRLGRVSDSTNSGTTLTVTCDNTYTDFGWENVALIKKGMWIEAYDAGGARIADTSDGVVTSTSTNSWKVTAVTFGDRANSTATTGTFTITATNAATIDALGGGTNVFDDGAIIYLAGTKSNQSAAHDDVGSTARYQSTMGTATYTTLPMGLVGIVQTASGSNTYSDGAIATTLTTFQGLTRSTYTTLNAQMYDGDDLGGTEGTPADWTLSVITDAINRIYRDTGGKVDALICSTEMAIALANQSATEGGYVVNVSTTGEFDQPAPGTRYAKSFYSPHNELIPVKVMRTCPANVLYGITTEDLIWYTKGDFDDLKLTGDVWMLSPNQRKAIFEAPFGGYSQIGAKRCDRMFCIQDMKNNV